MAREGGECQKKRVGVGEAPFVNYGHRLRELVGGDVKDFGDKCAICCDEPMVYAALIGCTHTGMVCWMCAVRSRRMLLNKCYLCDNVHAPLLSKTSRKWDEANRAVMLQDPVSECYCADKTIYEALEKMHDFRCWVPGCKFGWEGGEVINECDWKDHLWAVHRRKLCLTCYEGRKANLFPAENTLYLEKDIGRHRREGDDDRNAHYQCRVCRQWLFDEHNFERHWRESDSHEMCQICYADGYKNALFNSIENLRRHWATSHYPCLEASCEEKHTVFRDSRSLQLHMAKEHLRNSSFFENVGRKGILLRLDQPCEDQPFTNRQRTRNHKNEPKLDDDEACALWPLDMIAEAPKLLEAVRVIPSHFESLEACQKAADKWFGAYAKRYFGEDKKEIFAECQRARGLAESSQGGVCACLRNIVRMIDVQMARWRAAFPHQRPITDRPSKQQQQQDDRKCAPATEPWIDKREAKLSLKSELLLAIILAVPVQHPALKEAFVRAIELVAKRSAEAGQEISHSTSLSPRPGTSSASSSDIEVQNGQRRVLAQCTDLPINRNITFIVACEWAIREYLKRLDFDPKAPNTVNCPTKVPVKILDRMRSAYTKEEFEGFTHLTEDLKPYIEPKKLEAFLHLRPWYILHKLQVRRFYRRLPPEELAERKRDKREDLAEAIPAAAITGKHSPTEISKRWGQQCDQAFRDYNPQQLLLLRQYCIEARTLLPSAIAHREELVGGAERRTLFDGDNPALPDRGLWLDTRTRQSVPPPEDFPSLTSSHARARPAPTAWTAGSPGSSRPRSAARGVVPEPQRGAVTRMPEPRHNSEQYPALAPRRATRR